jgi:histidyl-tRNA synthetase
LPKEFSVPRGMKDIEPQEMEKRLWVQNKILEVLQRYGFKIVEPTPMEHLETLEAKSGPQIKDEIYWFADKAGRNLGLRFDLTVGMARIVANRYDLPEPLKLCAIADAWRYDEPQFGRYRHFWQWDAEIFGSADPLADAEAICVGMDVLDNVGLKEHEVRISNRKLVESYLAKIGVRDRRQIDGALIAIDKLSKLSDDKVRIEFEKAGLSRTQTDAINRLCSIKGSFENALSELSGVIGEDAGLQVGRNELAKLADILGAFGRKNRCVYDLSIVRGIGYYDGVVFEAYDKGGEDIGSIFGGGRYDKLCSMYGKQDKPATGLAGGIERLMLSLERYSLYPKLPDIPKVFVASATKEVLPKTWETVEKLRRAGIATDFDLKEKSLDKQLEYAHSMRIPYVIIIGRRELEKGLVRLRDMKSRQEKEIKISDIQKEL